MRIATAASRDSGGSRRTTRIHRSSIRLALAAAACGLALLSLAATATASAAGPSWQLTSVHGPTNVPLTASNNGVVTLSFHANIGKFTLEFLNEETGEEGESAFLPYNATAAEVQHALEKLKHGEPRTAIGAGNVKVSGGYDPATERATYTIEFLGALGGRYIGEAPVELDETEATEHEEGKFEREEAKRQREEEKQGLTPAPEREEIEPEGEGTLTTGGHHDTVSYRITPANRGAVATNGALTLRDHLPAGLSTRETPSGPGWSCEPVRREGESEKELEQQKREEEKKDQEEKLPEGAGLTEFQCTATGVVNPDGEASSVGVEAYVDLGKVHEGDTLENTATVSGGGAGELTVHETAAVSSAATPFGLQVFTASTTGPDGETYTQAGGRPYAATTGLFFNTVTRVDPVSKATEVAVSGRVKDVDVKLPAGFIGNPLATPRCSQAEFTQGLPGGPAQSSEASCPPDSQVGTAYVYLGEFLQTADPVAVYALAPPPGVPAEFGLIFDKVPVRLDARVIHEDAGGGEYRVTVLSADVNEAFNIFGVQLTLWGVPGASSHTPERFKNLKERNAEYTGTQKPFLINPVDCLAEADALEPGSDEANLAPITAVALDRWESPGALSASGSPENPGPNWGESEAESPPVTGCEALTFEPTVAFTPRTEEQEAGAPAGTTQAGAPSGYKFELTIPQKEGLGTQGEGELATPELKDATVTLPEGLVLSPAAANGLEACKPGEIELESTERGHCPLQSQVGSASIESQLLEKPLSGRLYVAEPECHPCSSAQVAEGRLLKLYLEAEEDGAPESGGVRVKLVGSASVNQTTGQVTTTFENNPQFPFEKLTLTLKGGPRAPLANPEVCGKELIGTALLSPWSVGGTTPAGQAITGTEPASVSSPGFSITGCPASRPFAPSFNAGTESSKAGAYSPLDVTFSRHDGEQDLSGVTVQTPPGLLGKIAGIPRCEGAAAESTTIECPAASKIGLATSAAGAGSEPYVVSGPVYLTGGYRGAPFGLKVAVPANAGPFELGTVVVRAAIKIDKTTSAITVESQPLPQSVDGIPFRLKSVKVDINRPDFIFNPTNCETQAISATLTGQPAASEAPVSVAKSAPFTASDCAALGFAPSFMATTEGKTSKLDGASLTVKVTQRPGEANIRKVELELPEALPSRNETLQKACTEKQFAANPSGCPEGSVVGTATAHTPLLSVPLTGPAYLVSHGGAAFPDLVFLLQGEGVFIELVGNTDIKKINGKEITFSKFETVPDAPINSFETDLPEGPHSVLDFYGDFCKKEALYAPTTITAQNNARVEQNTRIAVTGCPPTLSIVKTQVKGAKLLVTLKLSQAGTVKVTGKAITGATKSMAAGTRTLTLSLNRTGRKAARHHAKINVTASLSAAGQDAVKTATVKA